MPVQPKELFFVIPTHRLREVGEAVEQYDEHFWRNGHSVRIIIFDDSSPDNQAKYYPLLEQTCTHNDLYYVGPREKEQFLAYLNGRLRDKRLEGLVKNLFRPSYGGNRNYTLMYTLGGLMVSADDDMRPYCLIEDSPESLADDEVCRGKLVKAGRNGYVRKSFDILAGIHGRAGKAGRTGARELRARRGARQHGDGPGDQRNQGAGLGKLVDAPATGPCPTTRSVKIAQTFRSGTNDMDALDFVELFLQDDQQIDPDDLNDVYVLVNFRPVVTKKNWRMDCGVAGYDNTFGLPPFFPTRLRFEDYIYRLWVQQKGIAAAHVDAAQNHTKSNYMRNPPSAEIFNEEVGQPFEAENQAIRLAPG